MTTDVSAWACPSLATAYRGLGIERLHPWQAACLGTPGVFPRSSSSPRANLLFSAPTSGGKSLVAELLALASLAPLNGPAPSADSCALFILPCESACTRDGGIGDYSLLSLGEQSIRATAPTPAPQMLLSLRRRLRVCPTCSTSLPSSSSRFPPCMARKGARSSGRRASPCARQSAQAQ